MKIGILTQPLTNNYGGILQNFALQETLRGMGHEPVTLDIRRPLADRRLSPRRLASMAKRAVQIYLMGRRSDIRFVDPADMTDWSNTPQSHQRRFIDKYIVVEDMGFGPLTEADDRCEAYIVGSDQVWRPCYTTFMPNYFLDFTGMNDRRRIAYAASFGVDRWEMSSEMTEKVASLAKRFNGVSVREASGIDLCREYLGVDASWVLDPTMLLDAEDYRRVYRDFTTMSPRREYIACYVLDKNPEVKQTIRVISKSLGLDVVNVGAPGREGLPSIEAWLSGIDNAAYVITDSFHGSVFSLLFGKHFVALGNQGRGQARFASLFSAFGVNRLAGNAREALAILANPSENIQDKLDIYRKASMDFLKQQLD